MEFDISAQGLDLGESIMDKDVKFLSSLAKEANHGAIVEIGSFKGKSTAYLASGCKNSGKGLKVYAIDPHILGTEQLFKENINKLGFSDIVIPLVMMSEEAAKQWNQSISLLFIDGDHDNEAVTKDFLLWEPWLVEGGVIAFHDKFVAGSAYHGGPAKVIRDYILKSNRFGRLVVVGETLFATKGVEITFLDSLTKLKWLLLSYMAIPANNLTQPKKLRWLRRLLGKIVRLTQ